MNTKPSKIRIGLLLALALGSSAALADEYADFARVRSATPEYERINTPRQECRNEYVPAPARGGERAYGGSIVGGITGAIVGNQVGNGHGREAATALGAITGAIVGDRMQNGSGYYDDGGMREVRRCRTVDRWDRQLTGYRVVYEYAGRQYTALMPNDPGRSLRVRVSVEPD